MSKPSHVVANPLGGRCGRRNGPPLLHSRTSVFIPGRSLFAHFPARACRKRRRASIIGTRKSGSMIAPTARQKSDESRRDWSFWIPRLRNGLKMHLDEAPGAA